MERVFVLKQVAEKTSRVMKKKVRINMRTFLSGQNKIELTKIKIVLAYIIDTTINISYLIIYQYLPV